MPKVRRKYAHDGVQIGIDPHLMAEDGAFSSELAVPQAIGDHHGIAESWRGVARGEQAAEFRARPENIEIIGTDHPTLQSLGMLTTSQVARPLVYTRDR